MSERSDSHTDTNSLPKAGPSPSPGPDNNFVPAPVDVVAPPEPAPKPNQIEIKVQGANNSQLHFKIKKTTVMSKVMDAWYAKEGAMEGSLRFLFDGQRIVPTDTPSSLEMESGDTIEVHAGQTGGALASMV